MLGFRTPHNSRSVHLKTNHVSHSFAQDLPKDFVVKQEHESNVFFTTLNSPSSSLPLTLTLCSSLLHSLAISPFCPTQSLRVVLKGLSQILKYSFPRYSWNNSSILGLWSIVTENTGISKKKKTSRLSRETHFILVFSKLSSFIFFPRTYKFWDSLILINY